jgi:hypothetical protein
MIHFLAQIKDKRISITRNDWLMLFRELIAVYSKNHMKPINTLCGLSAGLVNVKACGTYRCHSALKG